MDVVILTPIAIEYSIVRRFLSNLKMKRIANFTCEVGQFEGKYHKFQIAIRETGSKETTAALATQAIIENLNPSILILLGICGGVKDVKIGDVVVGTKAYGYEAGKETPDGFVARPESYHYDKELIEHIKILEYSFDRDKLNPNHEEVKVFYGPIASGNKVIASTNSHIFHQLKLHYNDTTAVEMEATGFAEAAFMYKNVRILNIRGVSDLLEGKTKSDTEGSQEYAIENASAFVFELLFHFNPEDWFTPNSLNKKSTDLSSGNFSKEMKTSLGNLIRKGQSGEAIRKLQEYLPTLNHKDREQVLHLTDRWGEYTRKRRMGLLDAHRLNVERGQIVASLIELIGT